MLNRYALEKMKKIWDIQTRFEYYLKTELAACEAYSQLGQIPLEDLEFIKSNAKFDLTRIEEIEKEVCHDVIAFLTNINENLGEKSRYIHMGLTSSDVIDTAFSLQIKESSEIIAEDIAELIVSVKKLALKHKKTVCIGRSHGIHAEVTTFGIKLLNWLDILDRAFKNFLIASEDAALGQISGPVGTYSNVPVEIESIVCEKLGLKPAKISTQIISRDVHARFMNELAMIATVIEQFATEIRNLQRTEIAEVQEGFQEHQKGSSAMPHKRNPVLSENLCGLARVVRANAQVAMQNVVLWHERDISHSSAERIIFPDSCILVDFILNRFKNVVDNLVVNENNMLKNSELYGGIVYSQRVLLKLKEKGYSPDEAYELVQKAALMALDNNGSFKQNVIDLNILSDDDIEKCFNKEDYLKNTDSIFAKF